MALLAFHFAKFYKPLLISRAKTATVIKGMCRLYPQNEIAVYISEPAGRTARCYEKKIGTVKIVKCRIKKVRELTQGDAVKCGYANLKVLKKELVKWYGSKSDDNVTYVEFKSIFEGGKK